jgi:hypothetical protein
MPLSTFEKILPWSGALTGVLFAFQETVAPFGEKVNDPDLSSTIAASAGRGYTAGFASLAAALMLYFFAAAARASQRTGEAAESSYSSVVHGGLVGAGAGLAFQGFAQVALTSAAHDGQTAAVASLMYASFYSWLVILVGLVAAFWGIGLGGLRNATLPKWFAIVTVLLGVIGVLGPLAALVQIVLPLWLIVASVVIARRQRAVTPAHVGTLVASS